MDDVIVTSDDIRNQFHDSFPSPKSRIEKPLVANKTLGSEKLVLDGDPTEREQLIDVSRDVTTDDWIINLSYKESDGFLFRKREQRAWAWVIQRGDSDVDFTIETTSSGGSDPAEMLRDHYWTVIEKIEAIENKPITEK